MMISGLNDTVTLNNGVKMPRLGLGVWQMDEGGEVEQAVGGRAQGRIPQYRYRSGLRQRGGRGQGRPRERHTARGSVHHHQAVERRPGLRFHAARV